MNIRAFLNNFRDRGWKRSDFFRIFSALINLGLAIVFIAISMRVLLEWFSMNSSGHGYEWPLLMVVLSVIYIVVAVLLVTSQIFAVFGRWGRILVLCIAFFLFIIFLEEYFAYEALGFTAHNYRDLSIFFSMILVWVIINYLLWWPRAKNSV